MNVTSYNTTDYEFFLPLAGQKNKPNTNPNKPNLRKAKMDVNLYVIEDYRKKDDFAVRINKPNSNPISEKPKMNATVFIKRDYENDTALRPKKTNPIQTQFPSRNAKNAPDFPKNMVIEKNASGQQATVLIYPDALLLEPLFQIAHFTIENLVVVVFFQLLDIAFQLRLLLNNITQFLLEFIAYGPQVIELCLQLQHTHQPPCYGFYALGIIALHVSGNRGHERYHSQASFIAVGCQISNDTGRSFVVGEFYAVMLEGFFKSGIRNGTEESWLSRVGHKTGNAAYEIYHFDAELQ